MYYRIRRRIYNNICCINKLKDGLIRIYEIFNELELEILAKYLTDKNILFSICEKNLSYTQIYNLDDRGYRFNFDNRTYPEFNKIYKPRKLYIKVYKGFINLVKKQSKEYKYGIYLQK
jgi:hypothetical protein